MSNDNSTPKSDELSPLSSLPVEPIPEPTPTDETQPEQPTAEPSEGVDEPARSYTEVGLDNIIPTMVRMMSKGIVQRDQAMQNQVAIHNQLAQLNETNLKILAELEKQNESEE